MTPQSQSLSQHLERWTTATHQYCPQRPRGRQPLQLLLPGALQSGVSLPWMALGAPSTWVLVLHFPLWTAFPFQREYQNAVVYSKHRWLALALIVTVRLRASVCLCVWFGFFSLLSARVVHWPGFVAVDFYVGRGENLDFSKPLTFHCGISYTMFPTTSTSPNTAIARF